jgi:hypothetical protein
VSAIHPLPLGLTRPWHLSFIQPGRLEAQLIAIQIFIPLHIAARRLQVTLRLGERQRGHRSLANSAAVAWTASRGQETTHWRHGIRVEPRDVPPYWEGLDESKELWPYQEPGWRGKMRDGEMWRGEIN